MRKNKVDVGLPSQCEGINPNQVSGIPAGDRPRLMILPLSKDLNRQNRIFCINLSDKIRHFMYKNTKVTLTAWTRLDILLIRQRYFLSALCKECIYFLMLLHGTRCDLNHIDVRENQ